MAYKVHPDPRSLDSAQKIYDAVVEHLLEMEKPAFLKEHGENGICAYRATDEKNTCAFGYLIPEELYDPIIEGRDAFSLLTPGSHSVFGHGEHEGKISLNEATDRIAEGLKNLGEHKELLNELQSIHDDTLYWEKTGGLNFYGLKKLTDLSLFGVTPHPKVVEKLEALGG